MLEMGYFSSLYAQFRLLIFAFRKKKKKKKKKKLWAEDYAAETFYVSNFIHNNDYVVRLLKQVFHIILVFLETEFFRTPNYSLEELLIKSYKMQTGLHKHPFYDYRTGFCNETRSKCMCHNVYKCSQNIL